jgi:Tol biopolymer transport system component
VTAALLAGLMLIGATIVTWFVSRRPESLPQFHQRRLTANAPDLPVLNAEISPDGKYLGYADQHGIHLQLVETGGTVNVPLPPGIQPGTAYWVFGTWYPDSTRFLASVAIPGRPVSLWSAPILGGQPEKLAEVEDMARAGRISPDGSNIAYARLRSPLGAREIWLMGSHGESPHKILTAENEYSFRGIAWSPAGNRIAYSYARQQGEHMDVSVQSCDLSGTTKTTILHDNRLNALTWIPSGRFIYSRTAENAAQADNLWELRVDDKNGIPQGKARPLTNWSGFSIRSLSATADGKRLAFLRRTSHDSVFVGDLGSNGSRLVNPHRLTIDDYINLALAWTPDSHEVIFSSQRAATRLIYRQALDQGSAPQLITPPSDTNFYIAHLSPDGAWLVLEGQPIGSSKMALYRVAIGGGLPQLLFPVETFIQYWCSNKAANFCVFERPSAGKNELVVASLEPLGASGKELLRIPLEPGSSAAVGFDYDWQLSPDGLWIAILKRRENRIRLAPLGGGQTRMIMIKSYSDLNFLNWAIDSQSMFVSAVGSGGGTLLHVDLNGNAQPIWQQPRTTALGWGLPSPDGRHLAISSESSEANVWMISNF